MVTQLVTTRLDARSILGMPVHATSYADAVQRIAAWADARESRYVCEAQGHMVMESYDSSEYREVIQRRRYGDSWWDAHRLDDAPARRARPARGYGPAMTLKVCEYAALYGIKVGCYGGTEKSLESMCDTLS
jgi:N-acetylglucosaminyldiphosphoundecaprenol N-acetyl-beta-D-mannosaminyltransferase